MNDDLSKRPDGKYEERLSDLWLAEYAEDPATGLWEVEIFKRDVAEWRGTGYSTLEESRRAALDFYDQG